MAFWEKWIFLIIKNFCIPSPFFTHISLFGAHSNYFYWTALRKTLLIWRKLFHWLTVWAVVFEGWDKFCAGRCHAAQGNWLESVQELYVKGFVIFMINLAMIVTCVSSQLLLLDLFLNVSSKALNINVIV